MMRLAAFVVGVVSGLIAARFLSSSQPAEREQAAAESPPAKSDNGVSASASRSTPDSLTEIDGIGPAFEQALNQVGITTFAELARQKPDELAARLPARITADRIRRDQWIEQAKNKANEKR